MKIILRWLAVLLMAGVVAVAGWKQNAIATARAEHSALMGESEEARRLAEQNKEIERLRGESEELKKLREENKDLPKLRNEVRQLRRQAEELTKLRGENERLRSQQVVAPEYHDCPPPVPPDFIARDALVDAGLGSPEATVQTYFWAMCQGNIRRSWDCLSAGDVLAPGGAEWERGQQREMANHMKNFKGFLIAGRQDISPDEVELTLQSKIGGTTIPMKFKRMDDGWKLENP